MKQPSVSTCCYCISRTKPFVVHKSKSVHFADTLEEAVRIKNWEWICDTQTDRVTTAFGTFDCSSFFQGWRRFHDSCTINARVDQAISSIKLFPNQIRGSIPELEALRVETITPPSTTLVLPVESLRVIA